MERPEIVGGLKRAIERGQSIEQVKQSFLNSGYNSQDVEDSLNALGGVLSGMPGINRLQGNIQQPQINIQSVQPQFQQAQQPTKPIQAQQTTQSPAPAPYKPQAYPAVNITPNLQSMPPAQVQQPANFSQTNSSAASQIASQYPKEIIIRPTKTQIELWTILTIILSIVFLLLLIVLIASLAYGPDAVKSFFGFNKSNLITPLLTRLY